MSESVAKKVPRSIQSQIKQPVFLPHPKNGSTCDLIKPSVTSPLAASPPYTDGRGVAFISLNELLIYYQVNTMMAALCPLTI